MSPPEPRLLPRTPAADADPAADSAAQDATDQAAQAHPGDVVEAPGNASDSRLQLAPTFFDIAALNIAAQADRLTQLPSLACVPDTSRILGLSDAVANITAAVTPRLSIARPIVPLISSDLGLHQTVTKMATSWHLGLLDQNRQFAANVAGLATAHNKVLSDAISAVSISGTASITRSLSMTPLWGDAARLSDLFRGWRQIADVGLGLMRRIAQVALAAALRARDAVLHGEDEPVANFIERWLGLTATPERIDAVSAALLEEGWDTSADDLGRLLSDLKRRTRRQARVLKPIWDTRLNYRRVGLLDQPVVNGNGTLRPVADLVRDLQTTEDLALADMWDHEQHLRHVLDRLKPDELDITNLYAHHAQFTWAEAARAAGVPNPVAMGERVRRKLKRLGKEQERRLALQPSGA